jgi:hypothetical protein
MSDYVFCLECRYREDCLAFYYGVLSGCFDYRGYEKKVGN